MIQMFDGKHPEIASGAYVHQSAVIIGDVKLFEQASVWPCAVLRGDIARIKVGRNSNIQDGAMLHTDHLPLVIGSFVTVGHGAVLHSCDIGDNTLIGMGAIVLDAAHVGENCIVAAGTVIPGGKVIEPRSLVMGNPYRVVRQLTDAEIDNIRKNAETYVTLAKKHIRTGVVK